MGTAIHHGAPGSFKSFSLIQRFAIPALQAGRVVVCNVRGFDSLDRIIEQFPDIKFPESARLIYLETTTRESRLIMAGWFHWVPIGALIIIDEGQEIYPDRRDFKLESLDNFVCPDGFEVEQTAEPRPVDVFTAYDKQRHYQWDIFISTTNVAKIKSEIRQVTEWAYRHRSLAGLLPFMSNYWLESQHDPENNGKSESHRIGSPIRYKADSRIFRCYKSTATGSVTQSTAGKSIFKNPALLFPIIAVFCSFCLFIYLFTDKTSDNSESIVSPVQTDSLPVNNPVEIVKNDNVQTVFKSSDSLSAVKTNAIGVSRYDLVSIAYSDVKDLTKMEFNYIFNNFVKTVSLDSLSSLGYKFVYRGICAIDLISSDSKISLNCENPPAVVCSASLRTDSLVSNRGCYLDVASNSLK